MLSHRNHNGQCADPEADHERVARQLIRATPQLTHLSLPDVGVIRVAGVDPDRPIQHPVRAIAVAPVGQAVDLLVQLEVADARLGSRPVGAGLAARLCLDIVIVQGRDDYFPAAGFLCPLWNEQSLSASCSL